MNKNRPLVEIEDFVKLIGFHYEDINPNVLKYYLSVAAIKFARISKSIKREITINLQDGVQTYILPDIPSHNLYEIESVKVDRCCIKASNNCNCEAGKYHYESNQIKICIKKACKAKISVIALPKIEDCKVDEDLFNAWGEVIASGANATLMKSNNPKWGNKSMAVHEEKAFILGCEEALEHSQRSGIMDEVFNNDKRAKAIIQN